MAYNFLSAEPVAEPGNSLLNGAIEYSGGTPTRLERPQMLTGVDTGRVLWPEPHSHFQRGLRGYTMRQG
jgi:hypothetical protein